MRILSFLILICLSDTALAEWTLDNDQSKLHFLSTKKEHITEIHQFNHFKGTLDSKGNLSVEVDLASVNTRIPIRDQRMNKELFKVDTFPKATLTASLPSNITQGNVGSTKQIDVDATLKLHGQERPIIASIALSKLSDNQILATTVHPIVIDANQFNLGPGIETLKKLAGLTSISMSVPVTFSVIFTQ